MLTEWFLLKSKFFVSCGDRSRHRPITFEISANRLAAEFMSFVAVIVAGVGHLRFESVQIAVAAEFIATEQVHTESSSAVAKSQFHGCSA